MERYDTQTEEQDLEADVEREILEDEGIFEADDERGIDQESLKQCVTIPEEFKRDGLQIELSDN